MAERAIEAAALEYATNLAKALARKHYPDVPQWKPADDLMTVLTQIDNMTTGMIRPAALAEDDAAGGPEVKLRSVAQSLRATAAEGKNTIIMPDAAETFAAALTLAADIFEQWQARAAIRALGE